MFMHQIIVILHEHIHFRGYQSGYLFNLGMDRRMAWCSQMSEEPINQFGDSQAMGSGILFGELEIFFG